MENLKAQIIERFKKEIESLDFSLDDASLSLKYHSISESILNNILVKREKLNVPFSQTTNNNDLNLDFTGLCSGKSFDTLIGDNNYNTPTSTLANENVKTTPSESTTIPDNFTLSYEMREFAKSKFVQDVENMFEDFKLYYQSKSTLNADWEATWKRWVLNKNKFKNHLIKTTLDENLTLTNEMIQIAKSYIQNMDEIKLEFTKYKNHYLANGDLKVSWNNVWENWCINYKKYQIKAPKEQTAKQKEKADYKWDFRKAKDISDKIKDWLEFEAKINWMEQYYWKDIHQFDIKTNNGTLKLGWTKMPHPDFNKDEILLFKIDTDDAKYLLTNENIDTVEVIEHD